MHALQFDGREVRVLLNDQNEPWWVLTDVCAVLGIENSRDAAARLAEDERDGVVQTDTIGRRQEITAINESGLYRLIFRSDKPAAEQFRLWIFREVLPSIRKTGRYQMSPDGRLAGPVREHAEVSDHMVRVWLLLRDSSDWLSSKDVARRAAVASRTARAHLKYFLDLGLLDLLETFPGHLYRLSPEAAKRNAAAYQRIELIASVVVSRQPRLPVF